LLFIPCNRLEKSLQRSGGDVLIQRDRLDVLPSHLREQASHVSQQQRPTFATREAPGETRQKLAEQFAELCDILDAHETALRGFPGKLFSTRRVVSFSASSQDR